MPPIRSIVVCATKRSGSSFFCRSLGHLQLPEVNEWLLADNIDFASKELGVSPQAPYLERLRAAVAFRSSEQGIFATKVMANDFRSILDRLRQEDPALKPLPDLSVAALFLPEARFIRFSRDEKIAQAASLVKANQTGRWNRESPPADRFLDKPIFDFEALRQTLRGVEIDEAFWDTCLGELTEADLFTVKYEAFCVRFTEHLERLAAFCDVPQLTSTETPDEAPSQKISNRNWLERYQAIERTMMENAATDAKTENFDPAAVEYLSDRLLHLCHREQVWRYEITLRNTSNATWLAHTHPELQGSVVVHWELSHLDSGEIVRKRRLLLPHDVAPGGTADIITPVISPKFCAPLRLRLWLGLEGGEENNAMQTIHEELVEVLPTWIERQWNRYFPAAQEKTWGWRHDPVFGWFNTRQFPWLFHQELGWIFCSGSGGEHDDYWFWDWELKLLWTTAARFPQVYSVDRQSWLRYERNTLTPRRFQDLSTDEWIEVPRIG